MGAKLAGLIIVLLTLRAIAADTIEQASPSRPQVYRSFVHPHWLPDGRQFWYRNDLPGGKHEIVLIDAENGTRKILPAAPADGETSDLLPSSPWMRASRRTGEATTLTFANHTSTAVEIYWLDPQGQRKLYATVAAGADWDVGTFEGHVWLVTDKNGKALGVYQARAGDSTAVIGGSPQTQPAEQRFSPGRQRRRASARDSSPDGHWQAEVRDHQLYLRDIKNGNEILLGQDGRADDSYSRDEIWWSPDSRKLVAMRTEPAQEHPIYEVESSPPDRVQPILHTLNYLKPGDRIAHPRPELFDVDTHQHIPIAEDLFPNPWSIDDVRWSADSSRFTFVYNQRGHQIMRLISVDAANGAAKPIIEETSKTFIDYSGKYFCHWISDNEVLWMSERDGWNHLWLYDAKTGKAKNEVGSGNWVVQRIVNVDDARRQIWFYAGAVRAGQDPYYAHFCRVNFDGSGMTVLTEGDGNHSVQWTPGSKYFIDTWSRVDLPPITELHRSENGELICPLEQADASSILASRGGRWPARFVAKGRDGVTDIYGIILFPRHFDPTKKYPVLDDIYAGPQGFFTPKSFRAQYGDQQKLADRGMIVIQCDGMGTSGRSKAFQDVCYKNLRDAGLPDHIAWMKAAAKKYPQMDLTRVGIYGTSAGGQSAMAALLWHNDFYKTAVADCGCHDNRMDKIWWNEQWMGWPVDDAYAENSNVVNARLLKGNLMLIVSELDTNVDPASTMQVASALEKANKDFELVVITGADHGATQTAFGARKREEFLVNHLLH